MIRQLILRNLARKSCDLESGTESSDSETEEENDVSSATNGLEGSQSNRIVNMEITKL